MIEHHFTCPYCWEQISMLLDTSAPNQQYIEDCEVCCNPIQVSVGFEQNKMTYFEAVSIEQ